MKNFGSSSDNHEKKENAFSKKVAIVLTEFKKGKLQSGNSRKKVKSRGQAIATALSEARRHTKRQRS